ncbi:hypothetical protein BE04_40975 [Sorangium cellulosum]|uniref:Secreted protein n=2 Tax=Sorangium cellulosum TaxID=56 RepID=A0A150P570_SORCE|nr:hypothetical protein [Sorangium cellulosum]AGP41768.1 hypothetical protein SCE1572_49145 [Sorangium cellulosum So0157-2]KYF50859.1 hypothetical protein BE04_40975 [Sorangium cellulosum]
MRHPLRFALTISLILAGCDGPPNAASDAGSSADASPPPADGGSEDGGETGEDASAPPPGDTLSARYPDDVGIGGDPAVLFHDDFEAGWGRWDGPTADTRTLHIEADPATAHGGRGYLRSTVTTADLEEDTYVSSSTWVTHERADAIYWRFHVRFPELAPNPHHWVRMAAGVEGWDASGLANTVPPGDEGFWFDFDTNTDDVFNFYVYWHKMRSGRCNDGTAAPGCAGDQGSTYYYGNVFQPPGQAPFPRDRWFCVEMHARANTVGESDGALAFWIDDVAVGDYRPGHPEGTWLRAEFHTGGCDFSACTPPGPFEGFEFRSSSDVRFKSFMLDAYYERDSDARRRAEMEERGLTVSDARTILYDDVVVATERIGCRR